MKNQSDTWKRISLIWDFAYSDLKNRYRNSLLGFVWNFLEPLLLLSVLYVVFTNIFTTEIEFFPLYLLLGLIMWSMVVRGTQFALNSILSRGSILTQIHIHTAIPAISSSLTSLIMLSFEMIIFGIFLIAFQFIPPITILILPGIILLEFILVLGLALPLSVMNVRFRDVQFIWGIILHAGFFLHPIFYKIEILPDQIQQIVALSPMVQILNIARDVTLYNTIPTIETTLLMIVMSFVTLGIGYGIYKKFSLRVVEEL